MPPPPALFLAGWLSAMVAHRFLPLGIVDARARERRAVGGALIAAGVFLSAAVVRWLAHASTAVSPLRPTRALVVDGPYR